MCKRKIMKNFIGLKLSEKCLENISNFQQCIVLSNPVPKEDIHCSLFVSQDDFDYKSHETGFLIEISDIQVGKIKTQSGIDCLALFFNSKELEEKHMFIKQTYNARHAYEDLKLHITLSYDCGDIDINQICVDTYLQKLFFVKEFHKPLSFEINRRKTVRL